MGSFGGGASADRVEMRGHHEASLMRMVSGGWHSHLLVFGEDGSGVRDSLLKWV